MASLTETVHTLMRQGKGILAADESTHTADERFRIDHIDATEENRRRWRELLFTTPGFEEYISGVILFDETLRQNASDGTPLRELLLSKNVLVGIKVDQGLESVGLSRVTRGLEGLAQRLQEYKSMDASFTKWRAVMNVGDGPDPAAAENAKRLAEYASVAQQFGFVPIVEPEVLMDGAHSAEDAESALIETLAIVFDALGNAHVDIAHTILKSAMAVSGKDAPNRARPAEVAERTVRALKTTVPEQVGGVAFLSGGQSSEEADLNLNAIARLEPFPWPITFSFSRALQAPVMAEWGGQDENLDEAQALFLKRLSLAAAADAAGYVSAMESGA